ncbi:UDP-glycosyltransferase 92A1-like [Silene latifolia]|uniref:UDP-glycosyltransferase 92A1-like n=1 Tax=Silene latifolia TaxID=37657 RepID=UPI003D78A2E0
MASKTEHIILIPFMAQGHLRPFLRLALSLSSRTRYTITLLTTPLNAEILRENLNNTITTTTTANINHIIISELPFNSEDHNLPPNVENTEKLPLTLVINLHHAASSLEPHLDAFLTRHVARHHRPPVAIIFDNFLGWADRVARKFNSIGIAFTTCGAYGTAAYSSMWGNLPHRRTDEEEFPVPGFPEDRRFRRDQLNPFIRNADGTDVWSRFFQLQINMSMQCSGWLVNSVEEVEPLGFDILRNYLKFPVWAIGPLISSPMSLPTDKCIEWLNTKEKDSVLYISFGSQNTINPAQMMELAAGLEMSRKPFLWVIRPPFGFDINGDFQPEWLPDGFEDRVMKSGQGMMVHKWGPQLEILSHEAVGGFLSHCGWNSVLEGLREGVPIIGWPLAAEQAYNLKMLVEEMGVSVELARGLDREVRREKVKRVVVTVLDRAEGSIGWKMKRAAVDFGRKLKAALEVGEVVKGSSVKGMDDFVEFVESKKSSVIG